MRTIRGERQDPGPVYVFKLVRNGQITAVDIQLLKAVDSSLSLRWKTAVVQPKKKVHFHTSTTQFDNVSEQQIEGALRWRL